MFEGAMQRADELQRQENERALNDLKELLPDVDCMRGIGCSGLQQTVETVSNSPWGRIFRVFKGAKRADEALGAARAGASAFGGLSRAGQYGVRSYSELTKTLKGTGLQAHHLVEQRFAGVLGQNARQGLSVAVTQAEHQAFTNAWRSAIPYGAGTANATEAQIMNAARQIYADYPQILNALGL
jgi:hypothetical protein